MSAMRFQYVGRPQSVVKLQSCSLARLAVSPAFPSRSLRRVTVYASQDTEKDQQRAGAIEQSLKASGMDRQAASEILKRWSAEVGHEVTPEDLRKLLVGQSTRAIALVFVSTLLDAGAAYGSFVAGNFLGVATEQYGVLAVVGQALAYGLAGYYAAGAIFDTFKLGAVVVAALQFNINAAAFLTAIESVAGAKGTGLDVADKALDAANSVKVLQALNTMSDMLRNDTSASSTESSGNLLADLGAYLTLERAQRVYGFEASKYGLTDAQAAEIATVFSKFDTNDDGVLNDEEFRKLCAVYAPTLTDASSSSSLLHV